MFVFGIMWERVGAHKAIVLFQTTPKLVIYTDIYVHILEEMGSYLQNEIHKSRKYHIQYMPFIKEPVDI